MRAHPRWRGEHETLISTTPDWYGSSPLARGALHKERDQVNAGRLIPAGAGSTARKALQDVKSEAHPRWRGEHVLGGPLGIAVKGSSPLARGARNVADRWLREGGLIPAGAGSTHAAPVYSDGCGAHPRWRGEHNALVNVPMYDCGSSPLARGAHTIRELWPDVGRLIPAGAGSTLSELWFFEP